MNEQDHANISNMFTQQAKNKRINDSIKDCMRFDGKLHRIDKIGEWKKREKSDNLIP